MKKFLLVITAIVISSCGGSHRKEDKATPQNTEPQAIELCIANEQVYNVNHGCLNKCSTDLINGPTNCFLEDNKVFTTNTYSLNCAELEANVDFFTNLTNQVTGKVMECTCKSGFEETTNGRCINPNFNFTCNTNELLHVDTGNCLRECSNTIIPTSNPCYINNTQTSFSLAPTCSSNFNQSGGSLITQALTSKTINTYGLTNNQDYETITFYYCFPCHVKELLFSGPRCIKKCEQTITSLNTYCYKEIGATEFSSFSNPTCQQGSLQQFTTTAKDINANKLKVTRYRCVN
jgi:uncharacterized protein YfcZ (UPF0381/DUF406 family)